RGKHSQTTAGFAYASTKVTMPFSRWYPLPRFAARPSSDCRKCYDTGMLLRTAVPLLLLFVCASASPQAAIQTPAQAPTPSGPRVFHDASLGVTYFYPSRFTPAQPAAAPRAAHQCAQSIFSGTSTTPVGSTVFVLSTIDNTCPEVLQWAARQLGDFTREQVLRQLKQYGDPTVMRDPTRYSIDGHPAAITIASV